MFKYFIKNENNLILDSLFSLLLLIKMFHVKHFRYEIDFLCKMHG